MGGALAIRLRPALAVALAIRLSSRCPTTAPRRRCATSPCALSVKASTKPRRSGAFTRKPSRARRVDRRSSCSVRTESSWRAAPKRWPGPPKPTCGRHFGAQGRWRLSAAGRRAGRSGRRAATSAQAPRDQAVRGALSDARGSRRARAAQRGRASALGGSRSTHRACLAAGLVADSAQRRPRESATRLLAASFPAALLAGA